MASTFIEIKIHGAKDLERTLRELPRSMSRRVLQAAAKRSLKPVVDGAKARAPRLTGALAESISTRTVPARLGARRSDVTVGVGPTRDRFYGLFHEFGTVKHPARPFMRPAWDEHVHAVMETYGDELWKALERAVKRYAKR